MVRHFELAPPPVLMASASGTGAAPAVTGLADLFLPIDERALAQPFNVGDVLAPAVLGRFRAQVPPSTRAAFDNGVTALTAKDFVKAETSFKAAVQPDVDSGSALVYLAAVFAAASHDEQAAAAWQTSMADVTESPEVYDWLIAALLRTHSLSEAETALEEANRRWPADPRFTRPLALVYATFGKGVEATRLLQRYLEERTDDAEAARLGVEWIYQLHTMGALVHSRGDDLVLAREWARRYGNGPQQPLIQQWIDFLEKEK
jgi:predicted Zn-dependent protease